MFLPLLLALAQSPIPPPIDLLPIPIYRIRRTALTALVYPYPTQFSQEIPATEWFCGLDVDEPASRSFRISDPNTEGKDCQWTAPAGAPILDPNKLHPRYLAYYYFDIAIKVASDGWSEATVQEIDPNNPTKPMNLRVKP